MLPRFTSIVGSFYFLFGLQWYLFFILASCLIGMLHSAILVVPWHANPDTRNELFLVYLKKLNVTSVELINLPEIHSADSENDMDSCRLFLQCCYNPVQKTLSSIHSAEFIVQKTVRQEHLFTASRKYSSCC